MGELGMIKSTLKRVVAVLALLGITGLAPAPRSFGGNQTGSEGGVDYASVQQDILRFESVANSVISSTFSSSPFAVVQKAKGAYLEGYGISFAFLVNIHRALLNTPFGQVRRGAEVTPELKKQRIEELEEKLMRLIQENGKSFRQLGKDDHFTIIAFVEDRNFPDEPSANKTIVMTALKKDMDEFGNQQDRFQEFKKRIKIVEY